MESDFVYNTNYIVSGAFNEVEESSYNAIFPAEPVPAPRPALLAVLSARAVEVHELMAAVSAALSFEALIPPVPSFAIAAIAAAGMVSTLGAVTPARTVARLVVLRTEAWAEASKESTMMYIDFIMAIVESEGVSRVWCD